MGSTSDPASRAVLSPIVIQRSGAWGFRTRMKPHHTAFAFSSKLNPASGSCVISIWPGATVSDNFSSKSICSPFILIDFLNLVGGYTVGKCCANGSMLCETMDVVQQDCGEENNAEEGAVLQRLRAAWSQIPRPAVSHSIANPLGARCSSAETGLAIGFVANISRR